MAEEGGERRAGRRGGGGAGALVRAAERAAVGAVRAATSAAVCAAEGHTMDMVGGVPKEGMPIFTLLPVEEVGDHCTSVGSSRGRVKM